MEKYACLHGANQLEFIYIQLFHQPRQKPTENIKNNQIITFRISPKSWWLFIAFDFLDIIFRTINRVQGTKGKQ